MQRAITQTRAAHPGPVSALVFGCGLFHEAPLFAGVDRIVLVDVDDRLASALQERFPRRPGLTWHFPKTPAALMALQLDPVDLVVSKEVIEHLDDAPATLAAVLSVVRPGGLSWVSTPNYGDWTLPAIERTFLEAVARAQGFSRAHIHPNRYDADRLKRELTDAGLVDVIVEKTPGRLALCATGRRP